MSHAAFCLYILGTYDKQAADFVIDNREQLMVNSRNFLQEFDRGCIKLRQQHKEMKVVELYPYILDWCIQQQ